MATPYCQTCLPLLLAHGGVGRLEVGCDAGKVLEVDGEPGHCALAQVAAVEEGHLMKASSKLATSIVQRLTSGDTDLRNSKKIWTI